MQRNLLAFYFGILITINSSCVIALDLPEAERVALQRAPEVKRIAALQLALEEEAIASKQLSDPILMAGAMNLPTNTFDLDQEPMTQIQIGIQQTFPKGRSLKFASEQKHNESLVEKQNKELMTLEIIRVVRLSWLDLLYWELVKKKTVEQQKIFENLLDITESLLSNNKAHQHDVIRAQLELSENDNRLIEINKNIKVAKANLSRWIGKELTDRLGLNENPILPDFGTERSLYNAIKFHPKLLAHKMNTSSINSKIMWACEQYKPGITTGLTYGLRQGRNLDHSKRPDFVSANIKMDLPIFRANRQDRAVRALQENITASYEMENIEYKNLIEELEDKYATWQQYTKRSDHYTSKLIPQSEQYSKATLLSYKNGKSDFPTLARSYVRELDTKILGIKAKVELDKAHAHLLYLKGNQNV